MSRLRATGYMLAGAVVMAFVLTLVANPHSMSLAACKVPDKRYSGLTLQQKAKLSRCNLRHARGAIEYVRVHREAYNTRRLASLAVKVVAEHRVRVRKALRNLRAIEAKLYARSLWPWCRHGACVATLIRRLWPEDPEGAVTVAICESGLHADPVEGLSMTGQFVGVMQLGTAERAAYGHVGSGVYASSDPYTAIRAPAWEQITAAHNYFLRAGWRPWQCSPSGGLNW